MSEHMPRGRIVTPEEELLDETYTNVLEEMLVDGNCNAEDLKLAYFVSQDIAPEGVEVNQTVAEIASYLKDISENHQYPLNRIVALIDIRTKQEQHIEEWNRYLERETLDHTTKKILRSIVEKDQAGTLELSRKEDGSHLYTLTLHNNQTPGEKRLMLHGLLGKLGDIPFDISFDVDD